MDGDLNWIPKLKADYRDVAFVAVVVNPGPELLAGLRAVACFDAIQFHGDESPEFCQAAGKGFSQWIKALRVRSESDLSVATDFATPFLLLDAAVPGRYGGSGTTIDWGLASGFAKLHPERRVILAGGLVPGNVADAVRSVQPHAVDVASGIESAPGVKDPGLVRDFVHAAITAR